MELVQCHPSGAKNSEVALRVLENLCTTGYEIGTELVEDTLTISW
jgi:hypothetical protein